jgi:hypothetical protein
MSSIEFCIVLGQIEGEDVYLKGDRRYGILLQYTKCIGKQTYKSCNISVAHDLLKDDFDIKKAEKLIRQMSADLFIENYRDLENRILQEEAEWVDLRNK